MLKYITAIIFADKSWKRAEEKDIFKRGEKLYAAKSFSLCLIINFDFLGYQVPTNGQCTLVFRVSSVILKTALWLHKKIKR